MRSGIILGLLLVGASVSLGGQDDYNELIAKVSRSCENPRLLLTAAFTNEVMAYRAICTDVQGRCAADLALAVSLMQRMDSDEAAVASDACFSLHQSLVSNIVHSSGLDAGSWIRYAAAAEYMTGLNYGNRQDAAFILSTNMVSEIAQHPPNMGETNYWNAMSAWMRSPNETLETVFRLNAAVWLAERNRIDEMVPLTNSLPVRAIRLLREELNGMGDGVLLVREACRTNSLSTWEGQFAICEVAPLMIDDLYLCTFTNANCEGTLVEMYSYHSNELARVFQSGCNIKGVTPVVLQIGMLGNSPSPIIWGMWRHPGNGGDRRYELYEYTNLMMRALAAFEQVEMDGGGRGWFSIDEDGDPVARTNLDFSANRLLWTNQRTRYNGN